MSAQYFRAFVNHAHWGLDRILDALEHTPERLDEDVSAGAQSPRTTLRHMYAFERGFLARLMGVEAPSDPPPEDLEELRNAWTPIRQGWLDYVDGISDAELDEPFEMTLGSARYRTTRANVLSQFVQHQGQHRSELADMASTLGHSPGEFDWWHYLEQTGEPIERL